MDEIKEIALLAVNAAEDKKAYDVQLLEVKKLTIIADYFIICSGKTERQVKAIARGIKEKLAEIEVLPQRTAGEEQADWILLDYADLVVHVFQQEKREYYDLDRLWADAEKLLADDGKKKEEISSN